MSQVLPLPYGKPPLSLNDRMHHMAKARLTRRLRSDAATLARSHKLTPVPAATVTLHYRPGDNRTRDEANLHATLKPLVDGLVDAGTLTNGDGSAYVDTRCVIHAAIKGKPSALWLEVVGRELTAAELVVNRLDSYTQEQHAELLAAARGRRSKR